MNHVNNACYHNYVELGRVKYFREVLGDHINWDEQGFVLARTEMDHLEQIYLNDEVFCCTRVYQFGNKSARVRNHILKKNGDQYV
ncbi:acyl-CoA thioesterase, partial [Salmonella sp. SAL4436]|uniref:acyl-CoA thioesterase n=1 Tax=Salmonella sp. SAL4436 TaxID=3159891 RepID=UPI00397CB397